MPSFTVNSLKQGKWLDSLKEQVDALKQNFKDMQTLLRQNDAPTASNGGLLIPSSLGLETFTSLEFFVSLTTNWTKQELE